MPSKHPHHAAAPSSDAPATTATTAVPPAAATTAVPLPDPGGFHLWTGSPGEYFALAFVVCIGLCVLHRMLMRPIKTAPPIWFLARGQTDVWRDYTGDHFHREHRQDLGDARLATMSEIACGGGFCDFGIPLGQSLNQGALGTPNEWTSWLRYDAQAHVLLVAPAGSGKFRDVIAPALLAPWYTGSWLIIDPKGQAAAVTLKASTDASQGRRSVNLNPFHQHGDLLPSTAYNPMSTLDPQSISFGTDCDALADSCVWSNGGEGEFFDQGAKKLMGGFIMLYRKYWAPADQTLVAVREAISNPEVFAEAVAFAMSDKCDDDIIKGRLARYNKLKDTDRTSASVLHTLDVQTAFIDSSVAMKRSLSASEFNFRMLREPGQTRVFLILPGEQLDTCAKWFRLVVGSALRELMQDIRGTQVTMLLDECAQLGHLAILETAMALARGYKIRLWPIFQDLNQVKGIYGDRWETFLSNSAVQQFFAPRDMFTAEYLQRRAGMTTVDIKTVSTSFSSNTSTSVGEISKRQAMDGFTGVSTSNSEGFSTSNSSSVQNRPLLYAHDFLNMPDHNQFIFMDGVRRPIRAGRWAYWNIPGLEGWACPDPYHMPDEPRQVIPLAQPQPALLPPPLQRRDDAEPEEPETLYG